MTKSRDLSTVYGTVLVSGSFSAVSSVSLSSYLSDTYLRYKLYITAYGSSAVDVYMRCRENTTDKAAGYYGGGNYGDYTGATGQYGAVSNGAQWNIGGLQTSSNYSSFDITIHRPSATYGLINSLTFNEAPAKAIQTSGSCKGMSNFNGVSFYPTSGTFTGTYTLTGIR